MFYQTTQEWHTNAQMNMTQASFSQKKAAKQCDTSRHAHADTVATNLAMYNELSNHMEQKVMTSNMLLDKLTRRAKSLQQSIKVTKLNLHQLEASNKAKDAPLQLTVWRMRQREQRPLRELVRDQVEVSLESEKLALMDCQRKMSENEKRTAQLIQNMDSTLREVEADMDQKAQALGVDQKCLKTAQHSWQTMAERSSIVPESRPRSPAAYSARGSRSQQAGHHESKRNEQIRQENVSRLDASVQNLEGLAKLKRDENISLIHNCERVADQCLRKTERDLQNRVNENQLMRKSLAKEIQETEYKMGETKTTVSQTRTQIEALEEPISCTSTCTSWRRNRAQGEAILDPVSMKLAEHQFTLNRSLEALKNHKASEKSALQDLHSKRSQLQADLKDKTEALHIDLNCLTHESRTTGSGAIKDIARDKLSLAEKVDPNFVPMAPTSISHLRARSIGSGGHGSHYRPTPPSTPSSGRNGRRPHSYSRPLSPSSAYG